MTNGAENSGRAHWVPDGAATTGLEVELLREQLKNALETFRFMTGLLVQAWGFLIAADAVLLGIGMTNKVAGPILVAALLPLLMAEAVLTIFRHARPILFSALVAETALGGDRASLVRGYVQFALPSYASSMLDLIANGEPLPRRDPRLQASLLKSSKVRVFFAGSIVQLLFGVAVVAWFDWPIL